MSEIDDLEEIAATGAFNVNLSARAHSGRKRSTILSRVSNHPSAGKTLGRHGETAQPGGPDQSAVPVRKARGTIGGVANAP